MKLSKIAFQLTVVGSLIAVLPVAPIFAQGSTAEQPAKTRAQVIAERDAFLSTHEWSEVESDWELKNGAPTPSTGTKSRAQVKGERDSFLSMHKWDNSSNTFILAPQARDMSGMSKEQVKAEAAEFHRMYVWSTPNSKYVLRTSPLGGAKY